MTSPQKRSHTHHNSESRYGTPPHTKDYACICMDIRVYHNQPSNRQQIAYTHMHMLTNTPTSNNSQHPDDNHTTHEVFNVQTTPTLSPASSG